MCIRDRTQNDLYAALQDEYSYLSGKLTAKTAQEVDSYAAAQGLCKVQDYQVSYIRLNDTDVAVRTEAAPSGSVLELSLIHIWEMKQASYEFAENILRTSQEVVAKSLGNITTTRQALAQAASQAGLREEPLEK